MSEITFSDILITPQYSEVMSRSNVDIGTLLHESVHLDFPVISANMPHITGPKMAICMDSYGGMGVLHRFNTVKEAVQDFESAVFREQPQEGINIGVALGVKESDMERFEALYRVGARLFIIDVAHGHHVLVKNMIDRVKSRHNDVVVMAGNVATAEGALDLTEWGADILKVGIGPGAVCMTRRNTGVGAPQFSALKEIASVAKVPFIADGGIKSPGDVAKALIYADAVMVGSFIAGTSETPGKVFRNEGGDFYKVYGGNASAETKVGNGQESKFVEGITKIVRFQGHVKHILREIRDGLQSAFSYSGASNLKEFQAKVKWRIISGAGKEESKI